MINLVRFKDLFNVVSEKNTDKDIPLLAASQSYGVVLKKELGFRTTTIDEDNYRNLKIVRPGNFCITLRSFQGGIEYSNVYGGISSAYTILEPNKTKCNNKYYKYYLKNSHFILMLNRFKISIRDGQNIPFKSISKVLLHNPSLDMQNKIVIFLDNFIERIDYCLEKYRKKIELLKEYKESLIYETVTKGLDADVEMKESGVCWIKKIPAHWNIKRAKDCVVLQGGGSDKKTNQEEKEVSLVNYTDVYKNKKIDKSLDYMKVTYPEDKIKKIQLYKNDLLITPTSETAQDIGKVNIVLENMKDTVFSYHILRMRAFKNSNPFYLKYYFNSFASSIQFNKKATGITRVTLSRNDILSNEIILPPLDTQNKIVAYLDVRTDKVENEIEILLKKIMLLKELKESIIYEAVTGKIDVDADGDKYLKMIDAL